VTAAGLSPGDSVVSPGNEVVSIGGELGVPHGVVVPLVAHKTRERVQAPQPDRSVLRARQQVVPKKKGGKKAQGVNVCDLRYALWTMQLLHPTVLQGCPTGPGWSWCRTRDRCVRGGSSTRWPSSRPWSSPARRRIPCQSDLGLPRGTRQKDGNKWLSGG